MKRGDWIQQFGGLQFHFLDPQPGEFNIESAAHALSNINRFTGHATQPYSVAEHSVHVSIRAEQLASGRSPADVLMVAKWGLIHDLSEAFTNDLNTPMKRQPGLSGFRDIEEHLMARICEWLGLPKEMPPEVKRADAHVFFTEAEQLMQPLHPQWKEEYGDRWQPLNVTPGTYGIGWLEAKSLFLNRFHFLFGDIR